MKLPAIIAISVFTAALPAFAAPSCGTYTVVGNQCATTVNFGWGTAGLGTDAIIGVAVSSTVSAPMTFTLTQLNSSFGTSYIGYFGILASVDGLPPTVITLGGAIPITASPGQGVVLEVTQVCFDPTCAQAAPSGAVANMFSLQFQVLAASAADLAKLFTPLLTIQFVSNGIVTQEEQELGVVGGTTKTNFGVESVNEAATPANRYSTTTPLPFDVFSATNPSSTQVITGTVSLYDYSNNLVASATIPPIQPLGAVGYLLVQRFAGDALGLFPYGTTLTPADAQGIFHGALLATFTGPAIFLAQEFNGNAMLNLVIF